jgi:hydroxyacylglutathione hydrolase
MILKQYYLGCLAHASYLVADRVGGSAAVIDPQRDIEQYLADAEELGCRIGYVFLRMPECRRWPGLSGPARPRRRR